MESLDELVGPVISKIATAISAIVWAFEPLNVLGDRPRGTDQTSSPGRFKLPEGGEPPSPLSSCL